MQFISDYILFNAAEEFIKFCFSIICHQDESILYIIEGRHLPLCTRCLGLHTGFFGLFIISIFFIRNKLLLKRNGSYLLLSLAISTTAIHWIAGYTGLLEMNSFGRFITGSISGAGVCFLIQSYFYSNISILNRNSIKNFIEIKNLFASVLVLALTLYFVTNNYHLLLITIFFIVIFNIFFIVKTIINSLLIMYKNNSTTINYEMLK